MVKDTFSGKIESAYGQVLPKPLAYSAEYEKLEANSEIPANENPTAEDILALVNNKRKANARQKAMQAAIDAAGIVKPTLENDKDFAIRNMVKILVAQGKTQAEAETMAQAMLG